jgi:hypothetical protein
MSNLEEVWWRPHDSEWMALLCEGWRLSGMVQPPLIYAGEFSVLLWRPM